MSKQAVAQVGSGSSLYDLAFLLLDDSQHGFIVLDNEQNILICNKQFCRWAELDQSQAIGTPFFDLYPHLRGSKLQQTIEQYLFSGNTTRAKFHDQQPVLPLNHSSGDLPHELHIKAMPDLHGGNYCIIEVMDTSRLHNIHQSLHTQTKELDGLVRSSIANDEQLLVLFNNPLFSVILADGNGLIRKHNQCAERLFSREKTAWEGSHLSDLLLDSKQQAINNNPIGLVSSNQSLYFAKRAMISERQNQNRFEAIPIRLSNTPITFNQHPGYLLIIEDHQRQALKTKQIDHAHKDIDTAFSLVSDAVIKTDSNCIIRAFNKQAEQLTACSAEYAIGTHLKEIVSLNDAETNNPFYISEQWIKAHEKDTSISNLKINLTRRDHQKVAVYLSVTTINYQDVATEIGESELIIVIRDNSRTQEYVRKLAWHNTHDTLTGLVNRVEFERQLEQLLRNSKNHQQHAVLHLGLDQLKIINNTCGHDAGDALLCEVTTFIKNKIGEKDTIARIGGDEFGILLHKRKTSSAHKFAQTLKDELYQYRFVWQDKTFPASSSIGLVAINITSSDIRNALSNAQSACLLAKESGRNRVELYSTGHNNLIKQQQRMQWHNRIQTALDENKLSLHGQLIVPANDQKLSPRLELLVRIADSDKVVLPDSFIPAAEHYLLMPKVDQWVVNHCLEYYAQLPEKLRIPLNINLSGQSIGDPTFLQSLIDQIVRTKIKPSLLCFELTETAAIFDLEAAKHFMNELAALGCEFALDDFGSGLSSLSYLKNLPVDYLKIDGDFVKGIIGNHVDDEILQSVNRIGHVMNIKTVAEYVETPAIQKRLREIGVDYLQGFLIHKPTPLDEFFITQFTKLSIQ